MHTHKFNGSTIVTFRDISKSLILGNKSHLKKNCISSFLQDRIHILWLTWVITALRIFLYIQASSTHFFNNLAKKGCVVLPLFCLKNW